MASALKDAIGINSLACRLGGDEFTAFVTLEKDFSDAQVKQAMTDIWHETMEAVQALAPECSISMGVCKATDANEPISTYYNLADKELYRAKETGKSRVCFNF